MPPRRKPAPKKPIVIHGRTVEMVPRARLKPYPQNCKNHPVDQLDVIEAIIRDSGWTKPLVIDERDEIIAGHGGYLVSGPDRLAMDELPCIRVTGLTPAQIRAMRISDNQAAQRGTWNTDMLLGELTALGAEGFDLGLTAFSPFELGQIKVPGFLPEEQTARAEETPPTPARPVVKAGEVWVMGDHRLIIGDSTDAKTVEKLLAGAKPHLMVTDPPYGVNYDPNWRNNAEIKGRRIGATATGKVENDDQADWRNAWAHFPGDVAYVWHGGLHAAIVAESLAVHDFQIRSQIIWAKATLVIGRGDYHWKHEPCWYAVRKGKKGHYVGGRKQSTVWEIQNMHATQGNVDDGKTNHGTQKPIECMRRPIVNNSQKGDGVYEPFCGSGTTLIACEMEGRRCFAIELDLAYAEVIIRRWEGFTKRAATREDGKTLADLSKPKRKGA